MAPGFKELLLYAKLEEIMNSTNGYCPDEIRLKLNVPNEYRTIGEYLDDVRRDAIAKAEPKKKKKRSAKP